MLTHTKKHPYRWTPIGSPEYLDKAQLGEFMEFYKTFYVPNNAVLSISGDIDIEQTKKWIDKYFGSIPKGTNEIPRPNIVEPPMTKEVRDTIYDNIQLPAVIMAYHIPEQGTKDYYAIQMLNTLLSDGKSSRLHKSIVDKQEKAMVVASFPAALEDPGLAIIFSIASGGTDPKDLEEAINQEIEKVKNEPISDEEYQKLRNQIEAEFAEQNSRQESIAENLADYYVYFGDANLINTEINRYMEVTKEDIMNAAKKYFNKNNRVVLYYLPKPKGEEKAENTQEEKK